MPNEGLVQGKQARDKIIIIIIIWLTCVAELSKVGQLEQGQKTLVCQGKLDTLIRGSVGISVLSDPNQDHRPVTWGECKISTVSKFGQCRRRFLKVLSDNWGFVDDIDDPKNREHKKI